MLLQISFAIEIMWNLYAHICVYICCWYSFIFISLFTSFFWNFFYCAHPQCGVLDIPHILTHLEVEEKLETSINVHPSQKVLNSAFFDIMKFLNWTKCAIIYDQNNGKLRLLFSFMLRLYWLQIEYN